MKRRILIALIACLTLTAFAGCGSSDSGDSKSSGTVSVSASADESEASAEESKQESKQESMQESKQESKVESKDESSIADPVEVSEESAQENSEPEESQESSEESSEAEESSHQSAPEPVESSEEQSEASEPVHADGSFSESDLSFAYNGAQIAPDDNMSAVLASIGDAQSVISVPSCIGVGEDKIYSYGSFKIESYPNESGEKVLNITIEGASVGTSKGIKVGMTADEAKAAYGTDALDPSSDEYILIYRSGSRHLDLLIENGVIFEIDYVLDV